MKEKVLRMIPLVLLAALVWSFAGSTARASSQVSSGMVAVCDSDFPGQCEDDSNLCAHMFGMCVYDPDHAPACYCEID